MAYTIIRANTITRDNTITPVFLVPEEQQEESEVSATDTIIDFFGGFGFFRLEGPVLDSFPKMYYVQRDL